MLGFKETQTTPPLYGYYIETDLDSIDDQPVDYSKKYADQDSDEVCGSSKKRHLSTSETLDVNKPDDELKVYCMEGTPLIISSASSMCDLRDLGTTQISENDTKQHAVKKPCFQSIIYSNVTEEMDDSEEIENTKEDKSVKLVSERCSEEATEDRNEISSKVSSPLMFSRSSSVGSLNSFEQHSIMDDRSSVSIFSTLTSGIISPSEIPDSPGEAMSPYIKNNKTEFLFPINDNEKTLGPVLDSLKGNVTEQFDSAFDDIPEDDVKVFDDEGDFSSVSNLSCLTYQTNSTRMSFSVFQQEKTFSDLNHKSAIKVSYSVTTSHENNTESCNKEDPTRQDYSTTNQNHDSSLSTYSNPEPMEIRLDESAKNACMSDLNMNESDSKDADLSYPESVSFEEEKCDPNSFDGNKDDEKMTFLENQLEEYSEENSEDEDDAMLEECIKSGMPNTNTNSKNSEQNPITCNQVLEIEENNQARFSDNESGDEDDLMKHCIELGMAQVSPINKEEKMPQMSGIPSNSCFETNHVNVSPMKSASMVSPQLPASRNCDIFPQPNFANHQTEFENAYSDEDENDALLDQCIKLGMPESKNTAVNLAKTSHVPSLQPVINKNKNTANCENDASDDENALLADCIQLGRPQSANSNASKTEALTISRIVTTRPTTRMITNIPPTTARKPDFLSHIKLSHANKSVPSIKKVTKPISSSAVRPVSVGIYNNSFKQSARSSVREYSTSPQFVPLGYRDNVPDGTSDVDDDDDDEILSECIKAGMPSDKLPKTKQQLPASTLSKSLHLKQLIQKKTTPSNDQATGFKRIIASRPEKQVYVPDFLQAGRISPSTIIDIDSMCVYRTEDTPILSPSASISDLSTLSFSEEKMGHGNYLNNSRNSDCSSESEDDELLLQCIRSGRPGAKRAVA